MAEMRVVNKKLLVVALMMTLFLAAMESTIAALATPTIARQLAGFDLMSLIFSSFLLTAALSTPVFGRLADLYGRKRILTIGILIFLLGCLLCGISTNMPFLIASRAIQGIGAGSIYTLVNTIAGDAFPIEERAGLMGALGSVWGIAGILGPLFGGILIDLASWHWVFLINIPLGIPSLILLNLSFTEHFDRSYVKQHRNDYSGIFTKLTIFVNIISFLVCIVMQGLDVYLPLYLQNVLGETAMVSGFALLPMSISWLIISFVMGKLLIRLDGKLLILIAGIWLGLCGVLFVMMDIYTSLPLAMLFIFMAGFGVGGVFTATNVIIQESVEFHKRGTAMGVISLTRTLGQTLGISALGAVLNVQLGTFFSSRGINGVTPGNLYQPGSEASELPIELVVNALNDSLDALFGIMLALSIVMVLVTLLMPRIQLKATTPEAELE